MYYTAREIVNTNDQIVSDRIRGGLVRAEVVEVVRLTRERRLDMVHKRLCDGWYICET